MTTTSEQLNPEPTSEQLNPEPTSEQLNSEPTPEQLNSEPTPEQLNSEAKQLKLYKTPEGIVLWTGIILSLILIILIGYYLVADPLKARVLTFVFIAHTFGGRAAGIGICIMNDMPFLPTLIYNFFLEIQLVFITYSLFVLSINNYIKIKWVLRISQKTIHNAEKNKDKIEKYGWIGIVLFVMAPLPGTGPVAGSILGYLLRMGICRNFSLVFSGTFAALLMWIICFDFMDKNIHMIQYILCGIIVFVLFSNFNTIKNWFIKQD